MKTKIFMAISSFLMGVTAHRLAVILAGILFCMLILIVVVGLYGFIELNVIGNSKGGLKDVS